MIVRAVATADHAAVRALLTAAFGGAAEADLVEQLRADRDAAIELAADQDGRILGHVLFSPLQAPFRALALAPVSVAPDRQGEGIGSALINAGHAIARQLGWEAIFVLGDPAFYRRFGYDPDLAAGFESPYSGDHFMALALGGRMPAAGGKIVYARAFASLA